MNITNVNLGDNATLTYSSQTLGYPASNVQFPFRTKIWQSTGHTDEWLKFDLGSAQTVNMVAIINTNLTTAAVVYFCGNASDLGAGSANWHGHSSVDQTLTIPAGGMACFYFTGGSYRWWFLGMADPTLSTITVGRVFFGAKYAAPQNFKIDYTQIVYDPSYQATTIGGQVHSDIRPQYNNFQINFEMMLKSQKTSFVSFFNANGVFSEVIITLDDAGDVSGTSFYGFLQGGITPGALGQLNTQLMLRQGSNEYHKCSMFFRESI